MRDIILQISPIEFFGVLFSIGQVILARYNRVSNYLLGIAGIILTLVVMFQSRLYAEFALNIYYLIMSIYGVIYWLFGKNNKEVAISYTNRNEWMVTISIVTLGFVIFYFVLSTFTDSDVPVWDSVVSAFAWAGMWLMAKRKLENWILLNISNAVSIPLMIHKELYLYALLSIILFVVAISGYFHWKNILEKKG